MVIDGHVQTKELEPLLVDNANSQLVEFELVNNYLTRGIIIVTYVLVHYHNDVTIVFNYLSDCNDQNDASNDKPIDVCTLEVYNLTSHVHSALQSCYQLENYKEL